MIVQASLPVSIPETQSHYRYTYLAQIAIVNIQINYTIILDLQNLQKIQLNIILTFNSTGYTELRIHVVHTCMLQQQLPVCGI